LPLRRQTPHRFWPFSLLENQNSLAKRTSRQEDGALLITRVTRLLRFVNSAARLNSIGSDSKGAIEVL
jgi:hypothetical protein